MEPRLKSGTRPRLARVLIVDDHEDTCDLYAEVLRFEGFIVDATRSAEEALDKIAARRPDVIVADYSLPRINGFELCRMLKANVKTSAVPVVIVTGYGPTWEAEAKGAGASGFLTKPLLPNDLISAIRDLTMPVAKGSAAPPNA